MHYDMYISLVLQIAKPKQYGDLSNILAEKHITWTED